MVEMGYLIIGDGKYGGLVVDNFGDGWGVGIGGEVSCKLYLYVWILIIEYLIIKEIIML